MTECATYGERPERNNEGKEAWRHRRHLQHWNRRCPAKPNQRERACANDEWMVNRPGFEPGTRALQSGLAYDCKRDFMKPRRTIRRGVLFECRLEHPISIRGANAQRISAGSRNGPIVTPEGPGIGRKGRR